MSARVRLEHSASVDGVSMACAVEVEDDYQSAAKVHELAAAALRAMIDEHATSRAPAEPTEEEG